MSKATECKKCSCHCHKNKPRFEVVGMNEKGKITNIFRNNRTYGSKSAAKRMLNDAKNIIDEELSIREVVSNET